MFAAYFCILEIARPDRVCIFMDGENCRPSIVNLFSNFQKSNYLVLSRSLFPRLSVDTTAFQSRKDLPFIKTHVWSSGRLKTALAITPALSFIGGGRTRLGRVLFLMAICTCLRPMGLKFDDSRFWEFDACGSRR